METLILLAAVLPLATFVVWPLFAPSTEELSVAESQSASLEHRKVEAFRAIKEAEFDQRMGKLSDEDYESLVARYRGQALEAMTELAASAPPPQPVADKQRSTRANFCPACGEKVSVTGKFCVACGAALPS